MPKFYKQNKKRIDPRYFLDEKIDRTLLENDDISRHPGSLREAPYGVMTRHCDASDPCDYGEKCIDNECVNPVKKYSPDHCPDKKSFQNYGKSNYELIKGSRQRVRYSCRLVDGQKSFVKAVGQAEYSYDSYQGTL